MTEEISEDVNLMAELSASSLAPGEVSDSLRPRIEELGLWRNVEELREQGATVVTDAVPLDLLDELLDRARVAHTVEQASHEIFISVEI